MGTLNKVSKQYITIKKRIKTGRNPQVALCRSPLDWRKKYLMIDNSSITEEREAAPF